MLPSRGKEAHSVLLLKTSLALEGGRASEREEVLIHPLRFARPPVSGGQYAGAVLSVVTDCPPETGGTSAKRGGGGWFSVFTFNLSVR